MKSTQEKNFPAQRINIDICFLPSYERVPAMLKNHYGIESGTSGLILYAESAEEIFADKLIAFANRPNRVKNRDLWDIVWLNNNIKNIKPESVKKLVSQKIADRNINAESFNEYFLNRITELQNVQASFIAEMRRFIAPSAFTENLETKLWWEHLLHLLKGYGD
jgi:predicted nucleotidyltransferase component of viral defense system